MSQRKSWQFRWRGGIGILFLIPVGLITLISTPLIAEDSWLDLGADALAWAVFVLGATFRLWATLYIGGRKSQVVVAEGPYSVCRNPLYLGSFLLAVSVAIFLKSLTFAVGIGLAGLAYALVTVPAEEQHLHQQLGDDYIRYCQQVPRYWPCFAQFHTSEIIEVQVTALRRECARASRWIWLPLIGEILAHLRIQPWWPHVFRLP